MSVPSGVPEHLHTVTPRLVVSDGAAAIDFYAQAFGAQEIGHRFVDPEGHLVHAEFEIGDSVIAISEIDDGEPAAGGVTAIMETYWREVDTAWERALRAGAEVIFPLADQFYGDRSGRLRDPFGQQWVLGQRIEHLSPEEIEARARRYFET
jgi:PhnB protein